MSRHVFPATVCQMRAFASASAAASAARQQPKFIPGSTMLAAKVYISEGRDIEKISVLQGVAGTQPGVALGHVFIDKPYNRVNFTLASNDSDALSKGAVALARAALQVLDLRQHAASHPRLGSVDHISVQPAGPTATMKTAALVAKSIGMQLGSGSSALPVMLYGHAHEERRSLAAVRRKMGYFNGSASGQWRGELDRGRGLLPDFGPAVPAAESGIACVGATPWVTNLNIPLQTTDMAVARVIARAISQRGGGMPAVEAMALPHTAGVEIACNLLNEGISSVSDVMQRVAQLATDAGLQAPTLELGTEPGSGPYVLGRLRPDLVAFSSSYLEKAQADLEH